MDQTVNRVPTGSGTGCVVCGLDQDADKILLCDGCDAEYHTTCLVPPLREIPEGDFYCKSCKDAKRHLAPKPAAAAGASSSSAAALSASAANGATQAGFAVQDEQGRIVPVRSEDVRESKYKGVLKLLSKGVKKPFVARVHKDGKYVQLGIYGSEIEAAHAYDKAAIQMFGKTAQLNFPHLHEGFVRGATADAAAASSVVPIAPAAPKSTGSSAASASPAVGSSGRGRGRGRGRGAAGGRGTRGGATAGGGGRGKRRLEDSPAREGGSASSAPPSEKKRKALSVATEGDVPLTNGPKYLGVQVFRGYSHAQIAVNGKNVNLGTFPTPVDAAIAYDKAALKYFGGEIGSKDALHDRVVLNFPNKRAELLKQLIEESMHQKARQASGSNAHASGGSSSANRSMQSAKHNLSIKKLENWLVKLQRSVKLVEAAHRVQWDGLPFVKPEEPQVQEDNEEQEPTEREVKLELIAGAGPTIKTDFTKKQQRLRASASHIQDAVNLMVQELKIYAEDTPVDAAFQPPPRSHALLDLMSTSRFLKLCSTINELAHSNATATSNEQGTPGEESIGEEIFAALVQTVVDYRTRLQMAASAEKQKLAGLVDPSDTSNSPALEGSSDAFKAIVSTDADRISREILNRAKYVKRKVQRIGKVKKTPPLAIKAAEAADEEQKEEEVEKVAETSEAPVSEEPEAQEEKKESEPVEEVEKTEAMDTEETSEPATATTEDTAEVVEAAPTAVPEVEVTAPETEEKATPAVDQPAQEDVQMEESEEAASKEDATEPETSAKEDVAPAAKKETGSSVDVEPTADKAPDVEAEAEAPTKADDEAKPEPSAEEVVESPEKTDDGDQVMSEEPVDSAPADIEPASEVVEPASEVVESVAETPAPTEPVVAEATETAVVAVEDEEETIVEEVWEFCLALKTPASTSRASSGVEKDEMWRLLPLESESGEFVEDLLLTDDEVAEIEVSEAEVCGGERGDFSKASALWKPQLSELHQREITLRERVKSEADRRQALEGVIKIEQERLSQVFVVYRRMLEGIVVKSSDVQKKHQRITRDLLLVDLMKQTFAPILEDLLSQCESVFLQRLEKMADRFEDFQQEFEYYTDALLSVTGSSNAATTEQSNGHMKDEEPASSELPNGESAQAASADEDDEMDGKSSGLRGAYVSFYMEEIEALWKERCRAVESLYAISRSLTLDGPSNKEPVEDTVAEVNGTTLLRRRVHENLGQWKDVKWPAQLATPPFVDSFMKESSTRGSGASLLPLTSKSNDHEADRHTAMGELKQIIIDLTQENPTTTNTRVVRHSTLVVYHPVFLEHQTPKDHPECPERLNRIVTMLNSLRKKYEDAVKIDRLTQSPEELSPSESTLLAVHSPAYLQQLKDRAHEASANGELGLRRSVTLASSSSSASSALVFETNRGVVELAAPKTDQATRASPTGSMGGAFGAANLLPTGIAMDTYVSSKSWDVARAAAGTVCLAVDRVIRKEYRNAACLVRPPGHHVGRHGRTLDAPSSGFCLLNNVVIGTVHARQYPWIRRVAVLDWDIHHGNGTEELMRDDPDGFFASIHLYASGKFFPGTGKSEQNDNLVNVALENTGAGSGSAAFRSALQEQILPAMRAFQPDIIFISAGFDGHKDDILGGRAAVKNTAVPAGYLEDDYVWATQEVLKLADECCDGRVVSVLEGGYDVRKETNSLAKSVAAHVGAIAAYEQEKLHQQVNVVVPSEVKIKSDGASPTGVLLALLAKDMSDDDVVIIDDDDDEDDDAADKSGLLSSGEHDDDDDGGDEDDDGEDLEDMDGDGVEVDDDDDSAQGHEGHDVDEDAIMTDEGDHDHDHEDDHSADDDDADAHSTGLSFTADLSVDGDDQDDEDDDHHAHEDGGDAIMDDLSATGGSRIETPDYDHLDAGAGDEDGDEEMAGGHHHHHGEDDEGDDDGDLLGDEDHDELPSLS